MAPVPDTPWPQTVEGDFVFYFRSNSALDTNAAVADVRPTAPRSGRPSRRRSRRRRAIAAAVGLPQDAVKVHVMQGGGSFGRRLFFDAALEAAKISKAMGKPVKLMWHRADDSRVGRSAPDGDQQGPRDVRRRPAARLPAEPHQRRDRLPARPGRDADRDARADLPAGLGNLGFAESIFALTTLLPYDFAVKSQLLNETDDAVQHGQHAQHLLARRAHGRGAGHRPARRERWAWIPTSSAGAHLSDAAGARRARRGRRGRPVGHGDAARNRAGHRDPRGVQGRHRLPGRDRLPAARPSSGRSATA